MINQVGLVSQSKGVTMAQLAVTSAAIQRQISRDVAPIWNINATVDAFDRLRDVPVGYWPIIVADDIHVQAQGVHLNQDNGQPYALIAFSENWPLTTSHECIEMLVDPSGNRTVTSNSVVAEQGRVQYLLEVCDPCEAATFGYTVNGILLSDFYTPHFFDPVACPGVRYSYTGAVTKPHEVLDGGYLSWFDPQSRHLFQLFVEGQQSRITELGALPTGFSSLRAFADRRSIEERKKAEKANQPKGLLLSAAISNGKPSPYDQAAAAQAESLQRQIDALLK